MTPPFPDPLREALDEGKKIDGAPIYFQPVRKDERIRVCADTIAIDGVVVWCCPDGWLTTDERVRSFAERMARAAVREEAERKAAEETIAGERLSKAQRARVLAVVVEHYSRAAEGVLALLAVATGAAALIAALAGWI